MNNNNKSAAGTLFVLAAGVLWGLMGIFVRQLNNYGLNSMQIVAVRVFFAALLMAIVLAVKDRKLFAIKLKDIWCFIGTGICSIAFFSVCYFRTIELTSLSTAAVLLYAAPIIVTALSIPLFNEKLTAVKIVAALSAFAGCALVTGVTGGGEHIGVIGIITGLGSAFGYALYSIFGRYAINRGYSSMTITFWTFVFALMGILPFSAPVVLAEKISAEPLSLAVGFVMSVIVTVLPYLFYTAGLNRVESGKASVMASVEPVMATAVGAVVFGEKLDGTGFVGIVLVVLSILLLNLKQLKKNQT